MASKPQFTYLLSCAFIIALRISNTYATLNCSNMEGSSLTSRRSSENPKIDIETIKALIKVLLTELSLDDKESPNIEIKSHDTLSEIDRQEINELIKNILEELIDNVKNITKNGTEPESLVEITQNTLVHNCQERLDRAPVA
ncbi:uncharacterized protein LOC128919729 [Zeugodacus cucurbitae]|uniref:Putative ankyrin repeat protein FPV240 n=1 Tax=Zeugodacus cucurbitae TaxID=28588 RepID=A0A0A1WDX0_ZEUCU|nr:uncharacterized protein LOC128919729 [Zeugodacus cucurbitae]